MLKSCSKCGCVHDFNYKCTAGIKKKYKYTYEEKKLRSSIEWKNKSEEIREASKYLCAVCYDKGVYNYSELEVHHINKIKDRPDLLLDNFNLICLCKDCHRLADAGMIDKNYLLDLAKKREL